MSFRAGQRVKIVNSDKYSGFGIVDRVLTKNIDVRLDGGLKVRFNPYFLSADLTETPAVSTVPVYENPPAVGTVVTITATGAPLTGYYVVIGDSISRGHVMAKVAKLGGEGGRYWRVPLRQVSVVENVTGVVTETPVGV